MSAKADSFSDMFKAVALIDVPSTVKDYTDVPAFKTTSNFTSSNEIVLWPCLNLSGTIYNYSSQMAALLAKVDSDNEGIPYVSPSNKKLQCTGMCLSDGTEICFGTKEGEHLNGQGIVTANNLPSGWVCFGNRTGAYPGSTDPKDTYICVRRMFNYISTILVQTYWQKVDSPLNRRQINSVLDSVGIMLNGYISREILLGGSIEFLEDENPLTDLNNGITRFHLKMTPPVPNREIEFILEYDSSTLKKIFN